MPGGWGVGCHHARKRMQPGSSLQRLLLLCIRLQPRTGGRAPGGGALDCAQPSNFFAPPPPAAPSYAHRLRKASHRLERQRPPPTVPRLDFF